MFFSTCLFIDITRLLCKCQTWYTKKCKAQEIKSELLWQQMPHQQTSSCPEMIDLTAYLSHCQIWLFAVLPSHLNHQWILLSLNFKLSRQVNSLVLFCWHFLAPTEVASCVHLLSHPDPSLQCNISEKSCLLFQAIVILMSAHCCLLTYTLGCFLLVRLFTAWSECYQIMPGMTLLGVQL